MEREHFERMPASWSYARFKFSRADKLFIYYIFLQIDIFVMLNRDKRPFLPSLIESETNRNGEWPLVLLDILLAAVASSSLKDIYRTFRARPSNWFAKSDAATQRPANMSAATLKLCTILFIIQLSRAAPGTSRICFGSFYLFLFVFVYIKKIFP